MITVAVLLVVIGAAAVIVGIVAGELTWVFAAIVASLAALVAVSIAVLRDHRARRGD